MCDARMMRCSATTGACFTSTSSWRLLLLLVVLLLLLFLLLLLLLRLLTLLLPLLHQLQLPVAAWTAVLRRRRGRWSA